MATRLAALEPRELLIVDAPEASVLDAIGDVRAVLIVDEVQPDATPNARIATLARSFDARDLETLVDVSLPQHPNNE